MGEFSDHAFRGSGERLAMLRCEKRRSLCFRFLIVSFRARPLLLLSSRFVSLSPPSSVRPPSPSPPSPSSNVTSTMHLQYLPVCSSIPRQCLSWVRLGITPVASVLAAILASPPPSPGIEFRALSLLVVVRGVVDDFSRTNVRTFWNNDCKNEGCDW